MQALVKHSQDKDQFLKVAIKRMTKTQVLEDELNEVSKLNSVLLVQKQELEAFEAIMNESHIYQPTWAVWIFHQVAPSLVHKTVGIAC
jgi:hypothetical protein